MKRFRSSCVPGAGHTSAPRQPVFPCGARDRSKGCPPPADTHHGNRLLAGLANLAALAGEFKAGDQRCFLTSGDCRWRVVAAGPTGARVFFSVNSPTGGAGLTLVLRGQHCAVSSDSARTQVQPPCSPTHSSKWGACTGGSDPGGAYQGGWDGSSPREPVATGSPAPAATRAVPGAGGALGEVLHSPVGVQQGLRPGEGLVHRPGADCALTLHCSELYPWHTAERLPAEAALARPIRASEVELRPMGCRGTGTASSVAGKETRREDELGAVSTGGLSTCAMADTCSSSSILSPPLCRRSRNRPGPARGSSTLSRRELQPLFLFSAHLADRAQEPWRGRPGRRPLHDWAPRARGRSSHGHHHQAHCGQSRARRVPAGSQGWLGCRPHAPLSLSRRRVPRCLALGCQGEPALRSHCPCPATLSERG